MHFLGSVATGGLAKLNLGDAQCFENNGNLIQCLITSSLYKQLNQFGRKSQNLYIFLAVIWGQHIVELTTSPSAPEILF